MPGEVNVVKLQPVSGKEDNNLDSILGKYRMTTDYIDGLQDSKFIVPGLVIENHINTWIAPSSGGKTTIALASCTGMVNAGYKVFYVDADSPPDEHKNMHRMADEGGFNVLLPDVTIGSSVEQFMKDLEKEANKKTNFSKHVFFFDTLKKFANLMNKGNTKDFMRLMRKLTTGGATNVLLGHANKYKDSEGNLTFEGVGDVRNDTDNMIFLYPHKAGASLIVTTYPDKQRGIFKQRSFEITMEREVNHLPEVVDTKAKVLEGLDKVKQGRLQHIKDCIELGLSTRDAIASYCKDNGMGYNTTVNLLKEYSDESNPLRCFEIEKNGKKNIYQLFN